MITRWRGLLRSPAVWLIGLLMAGLAALFVFAYQSFRREAVQTVLDRDEQLAVLAAARLRADLEDFAGVLAAVARSRDMTDGDGISQRQALRSASARLVVFDGGVVLLDRRGLVRGTLPERTDVYGEDWSDREFFQRVLGETSMYVSNVVQDPFLSGPAVAIAVPVLGESDAFRGTLVGFFRLGQPTNSSFHAGIVRLRLGQTGDTAIVDGRGRILHHTDNSRVGRYLTSPELQLISYQFTSGADLITHLDGRQVVAAHAPVPRTRWTLIVEDDWAQVTQPLRRYRNALFAAFGASLLLPPLGLALLARQQRFRVWHDGRPEHDPGWAPTVRQRLQPRQMPVLPGWNVLHHHSPGRGNEHEFLDASLLPDGRLMLVVGAVGSGLPGALTLTSLRTLLRLSGQQLKGAVETLRQCNEVLCSLDSSSGVRLLLLLLESNTGRLEYAAAGMGGLRDDGTGLWQEPSPGATALGSNLNLDPVGGEARLDRGRRLVLLGPMMVEARDQEGRAFFDSPAGAALLESGAGLQESIERILDAFRVFHARSSLFTSDRTVVILERREDGAP